MKQHIDTLMQQNHVDALWISGAGQHNSAMVYFTGIAHLTGADLFVIPGRTPILCHGPMERDEAAKSGFDLLSYAEFDLSALLKETGGDLRTAYALRYKRILESIGLTKGKVLVYGSRDVGPYLAVVQELQKMLPELELTGDVNEIILLEARATKDERELERIRAMARVTTRVVGNTLDMLTAHKVRRDTLIKSDGQPLTIGDVKTQINLWLTTYGAENPEDTIFAIGRDAGVPHSSGTPTDPIRLGQTIVYDIFPCEQGGGYFYDFTRTWCLGYATDEVHQIYDQVLRTYNQLVSELKVGINPAGLQQRTCELLEAYGHETVRTNPRVSSGYVHSLGHGVGLDVHEKPWFSRPTDDSNKLLPGSVFTLEPGLYYPEQGYGIRLEDTYYVTEDGRFIRFADFPMDLVVPMRAG
ncbi:MAG: aminopeptidase P family protein [Chloroflexi bacterium]|jgi:Xaa-Pro aminopeptidase|nr:aminopeptidase P family protein [Chloroflexota bacterium]HOE34263.1 Xaa-Pro peptidase family protein [Anaerolineaceae bacterium]HOT25897.1 Xaa-Pro peptidase family protein [Anaerolineaceae bacterium]HQH58046.1 Xaa-Pro peptidase family protein [Anaerolineaceae bacterium]HQK04094.1 Xaa-Pro peptidase family protein [Anaerolineaceae bacterium]